MARHINNNRQYRGFAGVRQLIRQPLICIFALGCSVGAAGAEADAGGAAVGEENAARAAGLEQSLSLGAYRARGDYGESLDTEIQFFPLSYTLDRGAWGLQLLVSRLRVSGPGNVIINIGGVDRAVAGSQLSSADGLGDSVASLIYRLESASASAPFIDLRLDIKLPTADADQGLGTGEVDYSAQVDVSQSLGQTLVFATAGYTVRGRTALYAGLQNNAYAQLGAARNLNDLISAGVFYDYRAAASDFSQEIHEFSPYLAWRLSERWSLTGLSTWGFTDASADNAIYALLRYSW